MSMTTKDHLATLTPTQLAKAVGISRNDLNKKLAQCGLQKKHSGGGWILSSICQHGVQTRSKIKNDPSSEQAVQWQPDVLLESNVMAALGLNRNEALEAIQRAQDLLKNREPSKKRNSLYHQRTT